MIIRHPVETGYTVIANATLEDHRLSWKARGLLSFLLAKPDGWEVMVAHLINSAPDGRDSVMSGLKELEEIGYLVRRGQARQDQGRFDTVDTEIHECPLSGWPEGRRHVKPLVAADADYPPRVARERESRARENGAEEDLTSASTQLTIIQGSADASASEVPSEETSPVEELCLGLADRIEAHRGSRPAISAAWRKDMRLLVERGGRGWDPPRALPPEYVRRIVDGIFALLAEPEGGSTFCWADQVQSPGALRRHWDRIVLAGRARLHAAARDPLASSSDVAANLFGPSDPLQPARGTR